MDDSTTSSGGPDMPQRDDPGWESRGASAVGDPNATLEGALVDEFLAKLGHTHVSMDRLPADEREPLLKAALRYASFALAEVESRARMVEEIG